MNMRTYTNITYEKNRDIIQLMHILSNPSTSIEIYRNTFYKLGKALGALLDEKKHSRYGNTMLACASEDADWLAQGVLSSISQKNVAYLRKPELSARTTFTNLHRSRTTD